MTLQECYTKLSGSYEDVKSRLPMDRLIEKFMIKFLDDKTMGELQAAVDAGDIETSFRAAHTMKGVAANLGFSSLEKAAHNLTEQLRPCKEVADALLMDEVKKYYNMVVETVKQYQAEK